MKRNIKSLLIVFITLLLVPTTMVKAREKTLAEWQVELNNAQAKLNENAAQKAQTDQEIANTKAKINEIYKEMADVQTQIDNKTKESEQLEKDIDVKKEQTKDLMRYYQVASSGSPMLEYIMGATSLTNFIYRLSVTEQISNYNSKMVDEMNAMIVKNNKIKDELASKKSDLAKLQTQVSVELSKLNDTSAVLSEGAKTISESIKEMNDTISYLKKLGCKDSETSTACYTRIYGSSSGYLPSGTNFYRPTTSGSITCNYGDSDPNGTYHPAIDIYVPVGTPIYAVATGRVAKVVPKPYSSCGNQIILHHQVNGSYYTSYYCHLSAINVSEGDLVTKDTVIGRSGATGFVTGPHLHLAITTGRWYTDYYNYYGSNSFLSHAFDPRNVITFPSGYGTYYNR